jgi:predicted MFS family arabinose efflux permease
VAAVILLATFVLVESRVEHPLVPFRIFANQARAASFVAMALLPAAMFAMFFFLSLFIQNVMGYSPLQAGFAFLPFSAGIIVSATIVSSLVNRFDARYIAGVGTLVAAFALYGFSRLSVPDSASDVLKAAASGQHLGDGVNYWTQILPFVVLMALGMGAVFVPLTLTAVHHVRREDSGVGSGVLNTMQQIGGALGLAVLSTVSSHFITAHSSAIGASVGQGLGQAGVKDPVAVGQAIYFGSFTQGATHAFFVGSFMMLAGSLVVWLFLNVKHDELATDGPEGATESTPVHVG